MVQKGLRKWDKIMTHQIPPYLAFCTPGQNEIKKKIQGYQRETNKNIYIFLNEHQATRKTIMLNYMDLAGGQEAHKRDETNQLADHEKEKKYKKKKKNKREEEDEKGEQKRKEKSKTRKQGNEGYLETPLPSLMAMPNVTLSLINSMSLGLMRLLCALIAQTFFLSPFMHYAFLLT